jgi:hypothetical protein
MKGRRRLNRVQEFGSCTQAGKQVKHDSLFRTGLGPLSFFLGNLIVTDEKLLEGSYTS